ncbi:hypothetical protein PPBDW_I60045 [Photobacterium kishitanii]|nr:hypothetical protein PPBDW_I60045 [Photobacterium kishitanii]
MFTNSSSGVKSSGLFYTQLRLRCSSADKLFNLFGYLIGLISIISLLNHNDNRSKNRNLDEKKAIGLHLSLYGVSYELIILSSLSVTSKQRPGLTNIHFL